MKSAKKAVIISVAICSAVICTAIIVYAYFTDYSVKDNTITPAENIIEISEDYEPPVEQNEGENVYKKEIRIVNSGNSPCYIRVYMDFSHMHHHGENTILVISECIWTSQTAA